jgi:flagellar motor protein MotB
MISSMRASEALFSRTVLGAARAVCGAFLLATALSACVAQEHYDDAQTSAKHWQREFIEATKQRDELQAENMKLKAQLEAGGGAPLDASYTNDIDQRLSHLKDILAQLGKDPGDVTKFAVDGGYVYRVKDSILFAPGSSDISSDGQQVLATVAEDINSRPHGAVYVRGHTDNVPVAKPATMERFPHGNLQLSAARAVEVGALLASKGHVDSSRIVVMGFGPNEPVAPNDSDANKQKNRRVDIFVSDPDKPAAADKGGDQK